MLFSWSPSEPWNDTALPKAWVFARVYSLLSARCSIRVGSCRKLLCVHKDVGLSTSNALSTLGTAEDIADREDARAGEASVPSVILCFLRRMVGRPGAMAEVLAREPFPRPLDHVLICADSSVRPPMQVGYLVRDPCANVHIVLSTRRETGRAWQGPQGSRRTPFSHPLRCRRRRRRARCTSTHVRGGQGQSVPVWPSVPLRAAANGEKGNYQDRVLNREYMSA